MNRNRTDKFKLLINSAEACQLTSRLGAPPLTDQGPQNPNAAFKASFSLFRVIFFRPLESSRDSMTDNHSKVSIIDFSHLTAYILLDGNDSNVFVALSNEATNTQQETKEARLGLVDNKSRS